jgi:hypothetical protein
MSWKRLDDEDATLIDPEILWDSENAHLREVVGFQSSSQKVSFVLSFC